LLFENYGQEVGGTNTLLVPDLKVGGPVSLGPYGCCAYGLCTSIHLLGERCAASLSEGPVKKFNSKTVRSSDIVPSPTEDNVDHSHSHLDADMLLPSETRAAGSKIEVKFRTSSSL